MGIFTKLSTVIRSNINDLIARAEEKGQLFERCLQHPEIKALRRIGLMFAIDFDSPEKVNAIVSTCKDNGVIGYWFLSHPYSFRIAPPLTITEQEIRESCSVITNAINEN